MARRIEGVSILCRLSDAYMDVGVRATQEAKAEAGSRREAYRDVSTAGLQRMDTPSIRTIQFLKS